MHRAPALLACLPARVVGIERASDHCLLLRVGVDNKARRFAEPAELTIEIAGATHQVRRIPFPEAGRRGRSTPPHRSQTYWIAIQTEATPKRGRDVDVTHARFHDGPAIEQPPVTVGPIRHDQVTEGGVTFTASLLDVTNTLDRPADWSAARRSPRTAPASSP